MFFFQHVLVVSHIGIDDKKEKKGVEPPAQYCKKYVSKFDW